MKALALHAGRPRIAADGRVELFCAACWDLRDAPTAVAPLAVPVVAPPAPPPARGRGRVAVALGALAVIAGGLALATRFTAPAAAALPAVEVHTDEAISEEIRAPAPDDPPPAPAELGDATAEGTAPAAGAQAGAALDEDALAEQFPTLKAWIHPVTDSAELVPVRSTRRFGAARSGMPPRVDCGAGHCGVDLSGPRGRPVVAVAWGTVVRVEHSETGRDGKSGRYVRIEHPDGVFTSYMHLDSIAAGLAVGDEVDAGQVIGTLGKSAIYSSEEHLHFALEVTINGEPRFMDPSPFLATAAVVPIPARAVPAAERPQW